jgi:hypothetical protein
MARIRSVHPGICEDEALASVSASAERTLVRLWTHLDDDGRCENRLKLLKARLYPEHDDIDTALIEADLKELESVSLILFYEVDGKQYISAKPEAWAKYQKPRHPSPSRFPAPPQSDGEPPKDIPEAPEAYGERSQGVGVGVGDGVGEGDGGAPSALPFDTFWNNYPTRNGIKGSKKNAQAVWRSLKPADRDVAVAALPVYAEAANGFPKDAERYLRHRIWEGLDPSQVGARAGPSRPDRFAEMGRNLQNRIDRAREEGSHGSTGAALDPPSRRLPA